jgi:hypothetical protein
MLDRRTQPNLFDPRRLGVAATEEEPPAPQAPEPPRTRTRRRPDSTRRHAATARTLLGDRLRDPRVRRGARYAPVVVLLLLLLTHRAGGGRSVTATQVTHSVAASTTPAAPAAAAPAAAPASRTSPVRGRSMYAAPRAVRSLRPPRQPIGSQSQCPASPRAPAPASPPSAPSTPPATSTPAAGPPPSSTGSEPVRRQEESGDEFGFER